MHTSNFLEFYNNAGDLNTKWTCTFVLDGVFGKSKQKYDTSMWMQSNSHVFVKLLKASEASPRMKIHFYIPGFAFVGKARLQPWKFVAGALLLTRAIRRRRRLLTTDFPAPAFDLGTTEMSDREFIRVV